ncbi:glycoside hydrolase family 1 protein [Lacticaseibacillus jixiensis]|uniref:glycoside hydrolase family 1 protein n=1 Tax=Lacticaseibacillus jixiensis TaxID=3231926 RepID=UPI0036F355E2
MTFLLGTATAAHQVEGNNTNSDYWAMEHQTHSIFAEPSGAAVDHYHHYQEDIALMQQAGLNAYRFSIEWARIQPTPTTFDEAALAHYQAVIDACLAAGLEPVVTLMHFSSPKWLISQGGWEADSVVPAFAKYVEYVITRLGDKLHYVCTINEANMGIQIAAIAQRIMRQMGIKLQAGINLPLPEEMQLQNAESEQVFGLAKGQTPQTFLSQRTSHGDELIMAAHRAAVAVIRRVAPQLKVGLTLSLHDLQPVDDSAATKENLAATWADEFTHYLPAIADDDFLGVQCYSRELIGPQGVQPAPADVPMTQMDYEDYPAAIGHVLQTVAKDFKQPLIVTENGIATDDDERRCTFLKEAAQSIQVAIDAGVPVHGYFCWSLLDNFEWQKGFAKHFGVVAVDRKTQVRHPKRSLQVLGQLQFKEGAQ